MFDHRGWGSSEPQDRSDPQYHHVNVHQQADDYGDVVRFAQTLPGIDPERVAIWGIGHAGGASTIAASKNRNIKAVILDMPLLSGKRDAAAWPEGLLQKALDERSAIDADPKTERSFVKVWDDSPEDAAGPRHQTLIHGDQPYGFIRGAVERSNMAGRPWSNEMRLLSLIDLEGVEPWEYMAKISPTPMLLVAAAVDPFSGPIEAMREAFASAKEPKTLIELPKSHLENYFSGFDEHLTEQVEWARKILWM